MTLRYVQYINMIDTLCQTITASYNMRIQQYESRMTSLCHDIASLDPRGHFAEEYVAVIDEDGKKINGLPQRSSPFGLYNRQSGIHITEWTTHTSKTD